MHLANFIIIYIRYKIISILGVAEMVPLPGAKAAGKLLGTAAGWLTDLGASKLLPGDYMLVNILIELSKGTIHMDHFESPNFYLKIEEKENRLVYAQRELDAIEDPKKRQKEIEKREKASEIAEGSEFSLTFEKHYKTQHTNYHQKFLNTNSDTLNNDYCLDKLFELEGKEKFFFIILIFSKFFKISPKKR